MRGAARWTGTMLVVGTLVAGCPPSRSSGDDDDAGGGDWNLRIVNDSANTMELIRQRPCPSEDEEDWNEIPGPAGGLEPGDSMDTTLPQPGCFDLLAEGEGCFAEGTTGPMQLGDEVTWTIEDSALTCAGR